MIGSIEAKTETLETKAPRTKEMLDGTVKAELAMMRLGWALTRITGSPDANAGIRKFLDVVRVARYAEYTLMAVNAALLAPTPIGVFYAGTMVLATGVSYLGILGDM